MKYESVAKLQRDLEKVVIALLKDSVEFWKKDILAQFQEVLELVSFFFEDFRAEFNLLMKKEYSNVQSVGQEDTNVIVFVSWVSQSTFHLIRGVELSFNRQ